MKTRSCRLMVMMVIDARWSGIRPVRIDSVDRSGCWN